MQLQKVSKLHVCRYAVVYLLSIVRRNESISAVHSMLYNRPFDSNPTTEL